MKNPCKHKMVFTIETVQDTSSPGLYGATEFGLRAIILGQWCKVCGALRKVEGRTKTWGRWVAPLLGKARPEARISVRKHA